MTCALRRKAQGARRKAQESIQEKAWSQPLLVLAVYALVSGALAKRHFKWE